MQFYSGGYHPMVDYFNAMDPQAYHEGGPTGNVNTVKASYDSGLGVGDIGMSVPMGISAQNVQGIYSKIRMGAGNIEIGFPGVVRGQRNQMTPGMFGHDMRQAIRELGAINEVKFTTHSAYGIMGMSGFTGDNPYNVWFQREQRKVAIDEVKRAIDFARDTAGGGSVVVHTGEVDRPISELQWSRDKYGRLMFKHFEEEPEVARIRVVDERSGQVMQQVRKNTRVARPNWLRAEKDHEHINTVNGKREFIRGPMLDENGNLKVDKEGFPIFRGDYVDYEGNIIPESEWYNHEHGRVPIYDESTGKFGFEYYDWKRMIEEARERNMWQAKKQGKKVSELSDEEKLLPEEVYLRSTLETNEGHSRGWSMQYGADTNHVLDRIEKLRKALRFYEKLEKDVPVDDQWKIMKNDSLFHDEVGQLIPPDVKKPTDMIKRRLKDDEKRLLFARQASASQLLQAEDSFETQHFLISADKYALREAVKSYAEIGIHAMDKSINPKNPIVITVENLFPERYGGHPQELKNLIYKSREEMVNRLSKKWIDDPAARRYTVEESKSIGDPLLAGQIKKIENPYYRGMSEEQARQASEKHIKITLDTAHLNLWKKYWQNDPSKSPEENEMAYKNWYLTQVEDLAKHGLIGNAHLVDNLGYQDEHLAPGQGNSPIKEVVKILKKYGYQGAYTVEPGADASTDLSDFHGLMKTWRHFGSPIYGIGMRIGAPQTWSNVQYSYFGQNQPPYYVFGSYSPSNDWTLWTAVPME